MKRRVRCLFQGVYLVHLCRQHGVLPLSPPRPHGKGPVWDVKLLEPCDHTDLKPGCEICRGIHEKEDPWIGGGSGERQ